MESEMNYRLIERLSLKKLSEIVPSDLNDSSFKEFYESRRKRFARKQNWLTFTLTEYFMSSEVITFISSLRFRWYRYKSREP